MPSLAGELVEFLERARRLLVFTGAGISTGSGIPDFRGPQGVWKRRQPVYFDEFRADERKRIEYWDYKLEGYEQFRDARPNATHQAIARLEELGVVEAVITQNIDGLHQAGGSSEDKVVEVHGTNCRIECLGCGARTDPAPAMQHFRTHRTVPTCGACGGLLKPATIMFGQPLRPDVLERAATHAERADAVLALGSTLSVHPAASIPLIAVRRGAPYAIVNRGDTDHDALATVRVEGDVADFVPPAIDAVIAARTATP